MKRPKSTLGRAFSLPRSADGRGQTAGDPGSGGVQAGRPAGKTDFLRFAALAGVTFITASLVLRWLKGWEPILTTSFFYFLAAVVVTKLTADIFYFTAFPRYREWGQVDDYLGNDFLTFFRFGLPLLLAQTYLFNKGLVPTSYLKLWLSPAFPLAVVLVNRWKVERAQEARWARRRGALDISGRGQE